MEGSEEMEKTEKSRFPQKKKNDFLEREKIGKAAKKNGNGTKAMNTNKPLTEVERYKKVVNAILRHGYRYINCKSRRNRLLPL